MAPYDDWNKVDDDEDEELQDTSVSLASFLLQYYSEPQHVSVL